MSKGEILVYLAGCMTALKESGRGDDATAWRIRCREKLEDAGIKVFNPTKNSDIHCQQPDHFSEGIVYQNKTFVDRSDILLVNLDMYEESIGTIFETIIRWKEITVIGFGECKKWSNTPHFKSIFTVICEDEEDAVDYIISMYGKMI